MRYHYKPVHRIGVRVRNGQTYSCDHPVYNQCTLFTRGKDGLAVIQQRYAATTKTTWWTEIDSDLIYDILEHPKFWEYFKMRSGEPEAGIYPTVTLRQLMWALKMKPLKKEPWETVFDRKNI